jgi:hypothetical protein
MNNSNTFGRGRDARLAISAYLDAKQARAKQARANASLRMSMQADKVKPLPILPEKPKRYLIESKGDYVGTEFDGAFAHAYAKEHGFTVTELDFDS